VRLAGRVLGWLLIGPTATDPVDFDALELVIREDAERLGLD
jgi:hypothetical protein